MSTIAIIQEVVSEFYSIDRATVLSSSRKRRVVIARHVGMYLARTMTSSTTQEVAEGFDRTDHGTVLHAHKTVMDRASVDAVYKTEVIIVSEKVREALNKAGVLEGTYR